MFVKFIKFSQLLRSVKPLFLTVTIFQFILANAQSNMQPKYKTPNIVIFNSEEVCYMDADFNMQIAAPMSPGDSDHPYHKKKDSKRRRQKFLQQHVKLGQSENTDTATTKIAEEKPGKINWKASKLSKNYQDFGFIKLYHSPSQDRFSLSDRFSTDYIFPVQNCYDLCKQGIHQCQALIKTALDYLYSNNNPYYYNRSFDFCYVTVYSVRPPPDSKSI